MKIVVADGKHNADYIISMYNTAKNNLIVINRDEEVCQYLSSKNGIPVIFGRPTKEHDLAQAEIDDADLFVALSDDDVSNYVACKMAKQIFHVKKSIATVANPKNVDVFKRLGIDSVLSGTYLLGEQIRNEASIENLINTLTLENNKIIIMEIAIKSELYVCDHTLGEINITPFGSVSAIYRQQDVIIPNGGTMMKAGDKVLIVTKAEHREDIATIFQRKK